LVARQLSAGPRYAIIPAAAVRDQRLEGRDLQVLCDLGTHTDRLGWCRVSQSKMAKAFGCSRSSVYRSLERLLACDYLERFDLEGSAADADARRKAGTIQLYRVRIDRDELPPDLPTGGQVPAQPRRAGPARLGRAPLTTPYNDQKGQSTIWIDADDQRWARAAALWCAKHGRRSVPRDRRNGWVFPAEFVNA
jgi:hypothetical protein